MASIDWAGKAAQYLHLGSDATATRGDLLAALGDAVQNAIENRICRTLDVRSYVEAYDGNGKAWLPLRWDPVQSVSTLTVNGSAVTVGSLTAPTYPPAACVVQNRDSLILTDGSVFPLGFANVIATYSAGFDVPPADLVQAGVSWIALLFKDRDRSGLSSENAGGQTNSFTHEMPPFVEAAVSRWVRWGRP